MARQHSFIELPQSDVDQLLKLQSSGKLSVRKMKRVQVLLSLHDKILPKEIANVLNLSFVSVYGIKNNYLAEGLSSLDEKARPCHHVKKIKEHDEALITSIACSKPEEGSSSWTLMLTGDKFVELSEFETISHETIRSVL